MRAQFGVLVQQACVHSARVAHHLGRLAGQGDDAAMLTFYTDGQNPEAARRVEAFVGQQLPALVAHLEQVRAAAR